MKRKQRMNRLGTGIFTFISIFYILPIVVVLFNSFKKKSYINLEPFKLPNETTFTGLDNYTTAIDQYGFCPDSDQNHETVGELADELRQSTVWYMWWD